MLAGWGMCAQTLEGGIFGPSINLRHNRGIVRRERPFSTRYSPESKLAMTTIKQDDLIQSVADALQYISYYHPVDYITHLAAAYEREESPAAKDAMAQILINSRMAAEGHRPLCQDTGIVTVFLKVGMNVRWDATMSLEDMVNEGVRRAYNDPDNKLRASVLADPAGKRTNTKDNTPAVINVSIVPGDTVDVIVAAKGGGSEAKSKFAMLNPSDSIVDWVLKTVPTMGAGWCPPGMLGIGIGGTAEKAMLLAKEALMEPIDIQDLIARGPSNRAEELRLELYEKVNALGIGAQGLGGLTTVLDVKVKDYPTHAANLPVAMIPNCAATRHAHFTLDGSGPVMLDPPSLEDWPQLTYNPTNARRVDLDTITQGRGRHLQAGRSTAAQRQAAHRPRCRAQAHGRHAQQGRAAAGRFQGPLHLLRRPGRSGARRSGGPGRPHHGDAHGQVHRAGAGADRPARHGRQGRARPGRHRGDQEAPVGVPDGGGRRSVSRVQGDQGFAAWSASPTSAWRRSTSSRCRTCR